jgi:hypothetical protein
MQNLLRSLTFFLMVGGAYAQSNLPTCLGRDTARWSSCFGTETYSIGHKYVGEWKDGKQSGQGVFTFNVGSRYVGEFKDGKRNGQGTLFASNGSIIDQGIWVDNNLVRSAQVLQAKVANQNFSVAPTQPNTSLSNPPACQGSDQRKWNSCIGIENYNSVVLRKFVGIYLNGERNGLGIEYANDGSVFRSGTWKGLYNLVNAHAVDTERFPFNFSLLAAVTPTSTPDSGNAERDRLTAEVEAERKKRLELEQQLAAAKERDRVSAESDAERRKRQELEEQVKVAKQPTQPNKHSLNSGVERRVALVIGNATYKFNPLKNPVNDSTDMARSLRLVGFDVIEANNTTLAQMREVTRRFADKLGNSDVGLVYYSGHGVEVKGKNYLIPVNADIKREYEVVDQAFDASQFLEMMDNIRGPNNKRVNILIVDACRNNELQKSWRSTNNGLARMDAPGGTFISFATAPGRVAADGVGRNSPYTKHLLQALKQPNVPIEQVFKVVRRNVMEETKGEQIPWENSSLVGDFYFTVQR